MSRVSSTAKRYAGTSYSSHYSTYGSSLMPGLSSYGERDKLPSYKSSSSGYGSSSSYLSSSASRVRNYSTSSEPDRGRPVPRTDLLGASRRSESLSRTPVKTYGSSGLSGGAGYSSYSGYSTQPSYLSTSPPVTSAPSSSSVSISLSRRKSVSQSDLSRDLSLLGLSESSSSSSSLKQAYHSRGSEVADSYGSSSSSSRSGYGLARSSTQEAISSSSSSLKGSSGRFTASWERSTSTSGRSSSPSRDSTVRHPTPGACFVFCWVVQGCEMR